MSVEMRSLSGWGGNPHSTSVVIKPQSTAELTDFGLPGDGGFIARGLGRSYGDAAQLAGRTVIDMTAISGMDLDAFTGKISALAGTSLGEILDVALPRGWFLPVTPGTRHVTVGGAIAADVHGKNHHRDGSFGRHVERIDLLTGGGELISVDSGSEAFTATVGGMGLTGVIIRATFNLIPIESPLITVDTVKSDRLDSVMADLVDADGRHRYSVAWLDLSRGRRGRGIVMGGDHTPAETTGEKKHRRGWALSVPVAMPSVVNRLTVSLFNEMWHSKAPAMEEGRIRSLDSFFYPLDGVADWNRLYGPRGFLQYQFVVPNGAERTLGSIAETLSNADTPVSLAVLKRMGPSDGGMLSFSIPGWTLAVDMPLGDRDLAATLDHCDRLVARSGGRVYFAKDSRLRPGAVAEMYPDLSRWRHARARLDPGRLMRSNLSERLRLTT